ncbi:MAG: methyltransferase domain-containing protein [Kiritimatiellaeota bacterium]|nr:methyltransferase domain-containing protein [Kiritimatiellota bacterium]
MMTACPDCGAALRQDVTDDYVACPACGTFVLQARTTAEAENVAYFNAHFRETATAQVDARKQEIFRRAEARDHAHRTAEQYHFVKHTRDLQARLMQTEQRVLEVGFGEGVLLAKLLEAGVDAWGEDLSQTAIENFQRQFPSYVGHVVQPGATAGVFDMIYGAALFEHLDDPRVFLHAALARLQPGGSLILDQIPLAVLGPSDLTQANDICFWKPCHRVLHSLEGLRRLAAATGYSVDSAVTMDSFNYRVLSLHRRAGFPAIETIRNSCRVDSRLPGLWCYRWICWRAQYIRSRCHVASVVLRAKTAGEVKGVPLS